MTIGPQAGLTVTNSSTPLAASGSNFNLFTGTTGLTYFVRTTTTGGGGSITLKVTSDFSPTGGPSVASPLAPGDALTYTCTVAGTGGSTASVGWSLANDPNYKTGTYNSTVTFTISAS